MMIYRLENPNEILSVHLWMWTLSLDMFRQHPSTTNLNCLNFHGCKSTPKEHAHLSTCNLGEWFQISVVVNPRTFLGRCQKAGKPWWWACAVTPMSRRSPGDKTWSKNRFVLQVKMNSHGWWYNPLLCLLCLYIYIIYWIGLDSTPVYSSTNKPAEV